MNYNESMNNVRELVKNKNYAEAEKILFSLMQESNVKSVEDENNTHYSFNTYTEDLIFWHAFQPVKKNILPDINYGEVYYYLGYMNIEQKNYGKALEYYKEGLKWNPIDVAIMFEEAVVYRITGKLDLFRAKIERIRSFIYQSGFLAKYYRELGWYYIERKVYDLANALYSASFSYFGTQLAKNELEYIAKQENREPRYSTREEMQSIFNEYNIPIGFDRRIFNIVKNEYDKFIEKEPEAPYTKHFTKVLYDITKDEKYKPTEEGVSTATQQVETKENIESVKLRAYSKEIEGITSFKLYFPENLGEYAEIDSKTYEIKKDNKQVIRVAVWKCNSVEEHETKAKNWIEKNKKINKMEQVEYRKEVINNYPIETYVLKYTEYPNAANKIYKIAYINKFVVVISGTLVNKKEKIINQALEKLEISTIDVINTITEKVAFIQEWEKDLKLSYSYFENRNIKDCIKILDKNINSILIGDKAIEQDMFWKILSADVFKAIVLNNFYNKKAITPADVEQLLENSEDVKNNIYEFCNNFKNVEEVNFINQIEDMSEKMIKDVIDILKKNITRMKTL